MVTNDDGDGEENVISECNFSFSYYFFFLPLLSNLENAGKLSRD